MVVFCLIVFDSIIRDFDKFFEFIGAILLQKILEEKIIRTHCLSSYYWLLVTLPRFVGSAVGDCRNSGTSEFIRIVKRQSGVPSSARKA